MIIGILSDTHFGYSRFYEDSFNQFDQAFKGAVDNSDLVLIPGDIFDVKVPRFEIIARAMHCLEYGLTKDWKVNGIENPDGTKSELPVVVIHGTHDRRAKDAINPVQLLAKAGFVTNASDQVVVFEKDGERVAIHGLGGVPEEFVSESLKRLNFKPIEGAFNILMFHQTVADLIPMAPGIQMNELPEGFDLYLCGHIHKRVEMKRGNKHLLIPGSTVITQLKKEEVEKKAYVLYDTKTRQARFIDIDSRPFYHKELKFEKADATDIMNRCRNAIEEVLRKGDSVPIIKLQLTGTVKEGLRRENIDLTSIMNDYNGEKAHLEIDNSLDAQGLKERMETFRKLYEEKKSVREVGTEMLRQKLAGTGVGDGDVESLFELLSDEKNIDLLLERMRQKS